MKSVDPLDAVVAAESPSQLVAAFEAMGEGRRGVRRRELLDAAKRRKALDPELWTPEVAMAYGALLSRVPRSDGDPTPRAQPRSGTPPASLVRDAESSAPAGAAAGLSGGAHVGSGLDNRRTLHAPHAWGAGGAGDPVRAGNNDDELEAGAADDKAGAAGGAAVDPAGSSSEDETKSSEDGVPGVPKRRPWNVGSLREILAERRAAEERGGEDGGVAGLCCPCGAEQRPRLQVAVFSLLGVIAWSWVNALPSILAPNAPGIIVCPIILGIFVPAFAFLGCIVHDFQVSRAKRVLAVEHGLTHSALQFFDRNKCALIAAAVCAMVVGQMPGTTLINWAKTTHAPVVSASLREALVPDSEAATAPVVLVDDGIEVRRDLMVEFRRGATVYCLAPIGPLEVSELRQSSPTVVVAWTGCLLTMEDYRSCAQMSRGEFSDDTFRDTMPGNSPQDVDETGAWRLGMEDEACFIEVLGADAQDLLTTPNLPLIRTPVTADGHWAEAIDHAEAALNVTSQQGSLFLSTSDAGELFASDGRLLFLIDPYFGDMGWQVTIWTSSVCILLYCCYVAPWVKLGQPVYGWFNNMCDSD